jgi:hypothetical protein
MARHGDFVELVKYHGYLGTYSMAVASGSITATLAADSTLFSLQWAPTDGTLFLLEDIRAEAIVDAAVTTGVVFDLACFIARSFTVADSGGTSVLPTGNNQKRRTAAFRTTGATDIRIATTGTLTPGTRTLDAQPFTRASGFTGTAVGTSVFGNRDVLHAPGRDVGQQHPIVLAASEGLVIRNPLAGPATGTFKVKFQIDWSEFDPAH